MLIRGYTNAVGHELTGLSAYHTGPFNIFKIYRLYLSNVKPNLSKQHVVDAYLWALTNGYNVVSQSSTFKSASRAYLSSAYGAYRAVEHLPLDFSKTIQAELVTIRPGTKLALSTLLTLIQKHADDLDWGPESTDHLYENFRRLNPHLPLDPTMSDQVFVPKQSNIVFAYQNRNTPVRFSQSVHPRHSIRRILIILTTRCFKPLMTGRSRTQFKLAKRRYSTGSMNRWWIISVILDLLSQTGFFSINWLKR
jgi:hypothetical protein